MQLLKNSLKTETHSEKSQDKCIENLFKDSIEITHNQILKSQLEVLNMYTKSSKSEKKRFKHETDNKDLLNKFRYNFLRLKQKQVDLEKKRQFVINSRFKNLETLNLRKLERQLLQSVSNQTLSEKDKTGDLIKNINIQDDSSIKKLIWNKGAWRNIFRKDHDNAWNDVSNLTGYKIKQVFAQKFVDMQENSIKQITERLDHDKEMHN